jgi:hypothetical protein
MIRRSKASFYLVASVLMGFAFPSAMSAEKDGLPKVIGPDGNPVSEATVYQVSLASGEAPAGGWGVKKYDLNDVPDLVNSGSNSHRNYFSFFVIDSPGCALGIWQGTWQRGLTKLKLEKEFFIEGAVVDTSGEPVSGADVTIGKFGVSTYTNIHLNRAGGTLPWFKTRTNELGNYRFRGAIIGGYDFDSGVKIIARFTQDGVTMLGERTISFAGDIPFFKKARATKSSWESGPVRIAPTDAITGMVVDAQTGRPLPSAVIEVYGLKYENGGSRSHQVTTGEDGRFKISKMRIDRIGIGRDGYQGGQLVPQKTWRDARFTELKVPLRPLVEVRGRLIDEHTKSAPILPLTLRYEYSDPAGKGWSLIVDKGCRSGQLGPDADFKVEADGTFTRKLPVGKISLYSSARVFRRSKSQADWDPYGYHFERLVSGEDGQVIELKLKRKPGVLFKVNIPKPKPSSSKEADDWERVVV